MSDFDDIIRKMEAEQTAAPAALSVQSAPPQMAGPNRFLQLPLSYLEQGLYRGLPLASHYLPQNWALPQANLLPQGPLEAHIARAALSTGESAPAVAGALGAAGLTAATGGTGLLAVSPWLAPAILGSNIAAGQTELGAEELGLPRTPAEGLGSLTGFAAGTPISWVGAPLTAGARALESAGLPMMSPAYTSANPVVRWLTRRGAPDLGIPLGEAIDRSALQLGSSRTWDDAAGQLIPALKEWRSSGMGQEIAASEEPLVAKVPAKAELQHSELASRIAELTSSNIADDRDAAQAVISKFGDAGKQMRQIGNGLAHFAAGTGPVPSSTFELGRAVRTNIGNLLTNNRFAHLQGQLRYLYGGAKEDLGTVAYANKAQDAFNNFNTVSTEAHDFNEGPVEAILGAAHPSEAVRRLYNQAKTSGTEWQQLQSRFPNEMGEVAAAGIRQTGLAEPMAVTSAVSPGFARQFGALQAGGAMPAVLGTAAPELAAQAAAQRAFRPGAGIASPKWPLWAGEYGLGSLAGGGLALSQGWHDPVFSLLMGGAAGGGLSLIPYMGALAGRSQLLGREASRLWHPLPLAYEAGLGAIPPASPQ